MTSPHTVSSPPPAAASGERPWDEVISDIAGLSVGWDRDRDLPIVTVRRLIDAGFGALTVPVEFGGRGLGLSDFFTELQQLAAADPNIAQLLRPHFAFIQRQLLAPAKEQRRDDLGRAGAGELFATASHERSSATVGSFETRITEVDGELRLSGTKHYTTGSIYADWISVLAESDNGIVSATIDAHSAGVHTNDDWDGFGQRLTGSGTTTFTAVAVDPARVSRPVDDGQPTPMPAFYQLVLLATLAGIADAIARDGADFVRARTRVYSHGSAATAAADPLIQQVVGELSSTAFVVTAAVQRAVGVLEKTHNLIVAEGGLDSARASDGVLQAINAAEVAASEAQVVVVALVLDAATKLFDIGGASATSAGHGYDRHWRNARTLASHNPTQYKARTVGEYRISGTGLVYSWATGQTKGTSL